MGSLRTAQIGVGVVCSLSAAAVFFVHRQQKDEALALHAGVAKDAARMKWRRAEIEKEKLAATKMDTGDDGSICRSQTNRKEN